MLILTGRSPSIGWWARSPLQRRSAYLTQVDKYLLLSFFFFFFWVFFNVRSNVVKTVWSPLSFPGHRLNSIFGSQIRRSLFLCIFWFFIRICGLSDNTLLAPFLTLTFLVLRKPPCRPRHVPRPQLPPIACPTLGTFRFSGAYHTARGPVPVNSLLNPEIEANWRALL